MSSTVGIRLTLLATNMSRDAELPTLPILKPREVATRAFATGIR